ncbi:hypothetical protein AGMMS50239_30130 [Bacteroidia bacterium]|nr:hypothetical protein AGMMS50239_30130 [Bacteroidia bacterium]
MKKIYFLLGLIVCSFIFGGCYEDLGHYDYLPVNKVTITMPLTPLSAVMGDTLKYTPSIKFANPDDTLGFEYWWVYMGTYSLLDHYEKICDGRELRFVPRLVGAQTIALCVREIRSGFITVASIDVNGGSVYTKGWLILSEGDAGKSILSFIRPDREVSGNTANERVYIPYLDVYSKLYPADNLGTGPVAIRQAFSMRGIGNIFYVLQKNESVCLNGVSYKKEIKLSEEFVGGAPADLDPVDYYHGNFSSMIMNLDGTIYYRSPYYGNNTDFFTYSFANFPMEYQGRKLKIDRIIPSVAEVCFYFAVYDKENKCFLWVYAGGSTGGGTMLKATFTAESAEYLDYNNTGNAEILYSSFYNETADVAYNITLYSRNGELYVQRCRGESRRNITVFPATGEALTEVQNDVFPNKINIAPNTKYYQLKTRPYLFFATGGTVYWYDHLSKEVYAFYTFAGDEVVDMSSNPQESELGVLLKSGKFVTLDIVNEHLKDTNNKLYEIVIPGSRMVDLDYKFPDYYSYISRTDSYYAD